MKLTKIYTRTGDKGTTSLVGGQRTRKDSTRLEAYGTMDELSSHIGLLLATTAKTEEYKPINDFLERIQCNIFNISTFLATDTKETPIYTSARLCSDEVALMEQAIDNLNATLPQLGSFILPGGCQEAALCHICRTVCRRAERRIISLYAEIYPEGLNDDYEVSQQAGMILRYVNRLSDYLFVLSRKLNIMKKIEEKIWQNTCKYEKK